MNTLPTELILTIFHNLNIQDKRRFIRTCKTYYIITKKSMGKIKYGISKSEIDAMGLKTNYFWCFCDTLIEFRENLTEYLNNCDIKDYVVIDRCPKEKHEFFIEETMLDDNYPGF